MIDRNADHALLARFSALRAELADLAYDLERQGRCDAADITNELRARLDEFSEGLQAFDAQAQGAVVRFADRCCPPRDWLI